MTNPDLIDQVGCHTNFFFLVSLTMLSAMSISPSYYLNETAQDKVVEFVEHIAYVD